MKIRVCNITEGETFTYPLPLLIGEIESCYQDGEIEVVNSRVPDEVIKWPILEGCFKVLVLLEPGSNSIFLKYREDILKLTLILSDDEPCCNFVRPVYIICADDDGEFQGPKGEDCSVKSALKRITLAAQLIQTFTAEKMKEHGFQRCTFSLETNNSNIPICHPFKSKLTLQEAHSMSGKDLWTYFAKELMTSHFDRKENCKWYCFMSFTRYSPPTGDGIPKTHSDILKYTKGHTALGGGGLALFGTGNLHTWAEELRDVNHRFTDDRKIDRKYFMDDSAYRGYHWANYATGLGASLHELGHTFDLAHTSSGIMARGFDDIHKVFTVQRSASNTDINENRKSLTYYRSLSESDSEGSPTREVISSRRYADVCFGSPLKKSYRSLKRHSKYIPPPPLVVKVETGFKPTQPLAALTLKVKNYDGSEVQQTITQENHDLSVSDGDSSSTHKARSNSSSSSASSTSLSPTIPVMPSTLPNSPEESDLILPDVQHTDDGAHWSRSSAVLLRFHKWFNKVDAQDTQKPLQLNGCCIQSPVGIRLVELRSDPEGIVFHHWEFLNEIPPMQFTLRTRRVKNLPQGAEIVTVVVEDSKGNILKRKIKIVDFEN